VVTRERDNKGTLGKKYSYTGKVMIDATYEADLAQFAEIPYRIGREARSQEEPHAGRIFSSTHVAMCSVRMEPVWSALGQAAGVAAALAIDNKQELKDIPVKQIQDELLKQRCTLFFAHTATFDQSPAKP
jgi:hypothetical protein